MHVSKCVVLNDGDIKNIIAEKFGVSISDVELNIFYGDPQYGAIDVEASVCIRKEINELPKMPN